MLLHALYEGVYPLVRAMSLGRLAIHTAHLMDLFYINLFCSDMKRSVVLISIVRVPTYEYQLRPLPLSRLVSLLGAGSTSTKFS